MTCKELTATADRGSPTLAAWFAEGAASLWQAYLGRRAKRATVNILRSLDARTLKDIGIDPSEIESVVYGRPHDRLRRYRETTGE
jgi:uncharacterized protein YjiS (DUF1127 family)